ncbi:thiamine diphosphate-binding protein [Mycena galericulata]|nr:thiamine diphosphate-binding protein [Mycena galericulata]
MSAEFPIDLKKFKKFKLDPTKSKLSDQEKCDCLLHCLGAARGVSGHTGGAYDTVPEVCILLSLFEDTEKYVPIVFDEAGHRNIFCHYREANSKLPGHPELGLTPGVKFSSGRLGHMWPLVNGVALANRGKTVFCLGSDGSQQEGNDAEAARLAVAQHLNVKLIIDDNDVTIAGHPSEYLKGYDVTKTLAGHGLKVITVQGEDIDALWGAISSIVTYDGPAAVISKRVMAPGIVDIQGSPHGHDVIPVKSAVKHLLSRGYPDFSELYAGMAAVDQAYLHIGSTKERGANASSLARRAGDLEGSTGLKVIHQKHPEVFIPSGIMERGNFSAAAEFGVFSTFSAFLEMVISEITMARLNNCNMADNTCHFGINSLFADNGLSDTHSFLYFPADAMQMVAVVKRVFFERGLRFVFSTRSKVPPKFFGDGYEFVPGKDETIVEGKAGYVVSFGEMLYRSWDAVLRCRQQGLRPTIRKIGASPFVLIVESFNQKTGYVSFLPLSSILSPPATTHPKFGYIGTTREGSGGLWEQIPHQSLDPQGTSFRRSS